MPGYPGRMLGNPGRMLGYPGRMLRYPGRTRQQRRGRQQGVVDPVNAQARGAREEVSVPTKVRPTNGAAAEMTKNGLITGEVADTIVALVRT
eukprot:245610-Pyramimonas_sp.AAC.2